MYEQQQLYLFLIIDFYFNIVEWLELNKSFPDTITHCLHFIAQINVLILSKLLGS